MKKKSLIIAGTLILWVVAAKLALGQVELDAEIRPRTEYRHGYKTLADKSDDPAFFTSQRTRLIFRLDNQFLNARISLQDVRTWGSTAQLNSTDDHFSLHEAWGEFHLNDFLALKLGRQEVIYDDHRIFGNVGWVQQARSHDLALLKIGQSQNTAIHIGLACNQAKEQVLNNVYFGPSDYKTLQFGWIHSEWDKLSLSLLFLNNGIQYSDTVNNREPIVYSQTFGGHVNYKADNFKFQGTAYGQSGTDGNNKDLNGYLLSGNVRHSLSDCKIEYFIGFEILSGTDEEDFTDTGSSKNKSFTPFYGTNHKFNGHMDYFFVGNHNNNAGLTDAFAGIGWKPDLLNFQFTMHRFSTAAYLLDPANAAKTLKKNLGIELDFAMGYRHNEIVEIKFGYSQMFATETMEVLKGVNRKGIQNWAWLMFLFTPKLIIDQKKAIVPKSLWIFNSLSNISILPLFLFV